MCCFRVDSLSDFMRCSPRTAARSSSSVKMPILRTNGDLGGLCSTAGVDISAGISTNNACVIRDILRVESENENGTVAFGTTKLIENFK